MHIPSLVKIHWRLLKLSSGNEIRTEGRMTEGRTDRYTDVQRETIIPRHYRVAGYNKSCQNTTQLAGKSWSDKKKQKKKKKTIFKY